MQDKFEKCTNEHGLYVKATNMNTITIVCLYVNDLLLIGNNTVELNEFKSKMKQVFEMSDLGSLTYFLRMKFVHTLKGC